MSREKRLLVFMFVALATFTLGGCGADDSTSANASSSAAPASSNDGESRTAFDTARSPALSAAAMPDSSAALAANPALASDAIAQNMQASLAADSQQVAPVMRYAPGDSASSN